MINGYFKQIINIRNNRGNYVQESSSSANTNDQTIEIFSIIPKMYEVELDKKYGISLEEIASVKKPELEEDLNNNLFFNQSGKYSTREIEYKILKKYEYIPDFCSMEINNTEELMEHIKNIHELSYSHYVFGKETNLKGNFPNLSCSNINATKKTN